MRRLSVLVGAAIGSLLLVAPPAEAATVSVSIMNFGFSPATVTAHQGDTVTWTQLQPAEQHTSTSDQGFWNSPALSPNQTYSQTKAFESAGTYHYHCSFHPEMIGAVKVPMKAAGSASAGWRVRWSSLSTVPSNRSFDVQILRPGSTTWAGFRTDVKSTSAFFNPARTGTYKFRSRTRNLSNGEKSGYSPALTASIT